MKPLVILELANNHMGSLKHAFLIINRFYKLSKKYNHLIDFALKYQFRNLDTFIHEDFKNTDHKQVRRFEDTKFTEKEWRKLINYSREKFKIISTAFDEFSVDKIIKYNFDYLKIASCSYNDWPLIEYIGKKIGKKKVVCSLGGANFNNISQIITFFSNKKKNVRYLYCVAKYPTEPQDLNLSFFENLKNIYGEKIIGFSTHENPDEYLSSSISYSMGARIFEKHVGVQTKKFKLNKYTVDPEKLEKWLSCLKDTIQRYGSIEAKIKLLKDENKQLNQFRRGAFLKKKKHIQKGELINVHDCDFQFPCSEGQITANHFSKFAEIKSKKILRGGETLFLKNLKIDYRRKKIEIIRNKVRNLINVANIHIPKNCRLEVSHHYGIENFKKYGLCMITIFNKIYCKKLLFIFYKQKHPAQYHKKKNETFFILYGKVRLNLTTKNNKKNLILKAGDILTINKDEIHEFESISKNGSVIEELSTESIAKDSFYLDKKINLNKNRKSLISLY